MRFRTNRWTPVASIPNPSPPSHPQRMGNKSKPSLIPGGRRGSKEAAEAVIMWEPGLCSGDVEEAVGSAWHARSPCLPSPVPHKLQRLLFMWNRTFVIGPSYNPFLPTAWLDLGTEQITGYKWCLFQPSTSRTNGVILLFPGRRMTFPHTWGLLAGPQQRCELSLNHHKSNRPPNGL